MLTESAESWKTMLRKRGETNEGRWATNPHSTHALRALLLACWPAGTAGERVHGQWAQACLTSE